MYRPWHQQVEPPPCPDGWSIGPPNFVGIGAQRSGTSWWYDAVLRRHPQVQPSLAGKELHYFDWYLDGQVDEGFAERYHALFPRPQGKITGEWTPRYMADLWTARLLHEAAPDARLLVMLRDPVERFRSAVARERWASGGMMRTRLATTSDAIWRGFYHQQLQEVLRFYPRERVLILQFERCVQDPIDQMEATCRFLGIEPPDEPPERLGEHRRPSHPKPRTPEWLRADLTARYREDVQRLMELCPDFDLSLWRNFSEPIEAGPVTAPAGADERAVRDGRPEPDLSRLSREWVDRWLDENRELWRRVRGGLRRWAVRYGEGNREHFQHTAALVAEACRADSVRTVADVGSVPGYIAGLLAAAGLEVHAVDVEPKRVHPVYEELGVASHRADIEIQRIPLDDESVDLALCCQTLEGLRADPVRPLREIARILRPGGKAIVSVRRLTPSMRLRAMLGSDELLGDPLADRNQPKPWLGSDPRVYSRRQVKRMLEDAGLNVERVVYGGGLRPRILPRRIARALSRVAPRRIQGTAYYVASRPPEPA
jgi:SAM-dependent methyltransferase